MRACNGPVVRACTRPAARPGECNQPHARPFAVVHQYGKVRSLGLQRRIRRTLTCRGTPALAPAYCQPARAGSDAGVLQERAICGESPWLGARDWNSTWRD